MFLLPWTKLEKVSLSCPSHWGHILSEVFYFKSLCPEIQSNDNFSADMTQLRTKGQLISKCPFGVFKSSKNPTNFFQDFCPSLYIGQIKKVVYESQNKTL